MRHLTLSCHRSSRSHPHAFTLVELLVVVALMGILASITLTAVSSLNKRAKLLKARTDIAQLVDAIKEYRSDYSGHWPVSASVMNTYILGEPAGHLDFTFGTLDNSGRGILPGGLSKPLIYINNTIEHPLLGLVPFDYQANNSEVMSVLLDETNFHTPGNFPTFNGNHGLNPKRKHFLMVPTAKGPTTPGLNDDLVYRDPWGNPYIITLDIDGNGTCTDGLYRMAEVTQPLPPQENGGFGLQGLFRTFVPIDPILSTIDHRRFPRHLYQVPDSVAVWSFGPDGRASYNASNTPGQKADNGDNKDNLLSWKL